MATTDFGSLPVIDVSSLRGSDAAAKAAAVAEVDRACRDVGFFIVTNHQVPLEITEGALEATREFFDLPKEQKREVMNDDSYPYGYIDVGGETLVAGKDTESGSEVAVERAPDLKELFCIGPNNPLSGVTERRWPSSFPKLVPAYENYYAEMEKFAADLLKAFALALKLDENWFADKIDKHCSALRTINYPHLDAAPGANQTRASVHTDYGSLTILRQDGGVSGLEVQNRSGEWVPVQQVQDSFVINLGDLMSRWTNDQWVSTPHRVVVPPLNENSSNRRNSMAFFHNINADHMVHCIETCQSEANPSKYAPINAMDHLMQKHRASTKKD